MQADRRMIRDAEMIQFVEGAFVKLAMEKVGANPPVILDNLNGMVGIMLELSAAQDPAVLGMRPAHQQRCPVNQTALKVDFHPGTGELVGIAGEAAVHRLIVNLRTVRVAAELNGLAPFNIPIPDL